MSTLRSDRRPRTLWEEGDKPGARVVIVAGCAMLVVIFVNLLFADRLNLIFDIGFVVVCVAAALAVRPRDFFTVGVLPPLLMCWSAVVVALLARASIADPGDGVLQAIITALAHQAGVLVIGYALTLLILALRQMATQRRLPAQRREQQLLRREPSRQP